MSDVPANAPVPGDRVSASVFVEAPPAIAFEVFTEQIDTWWRHGMKFRSGARDVSVLHLEAKLGGRLFETIAAGGDAGHVVQTGTVTAWDPPRALEIEWRAVNFAPHEKTTVSVTFEPRRDGTQVTLVHAGWAALPSDHPVRHGQAVRRFIASMGLWWSDQMTSLRMRVAEERETPWLRVARAEMGVRAHPPGSSNPRIGEYHAGTNAAGYDDKASWCSSFVHWTLAGVGIRGTGSALARSWLDWGAALDEPRPGCIVVLWRDDPSSWKGHVGFFLRDDGPDVVLLGGNQLGAVCEQHHPRANVLGYRWPATSRR
ncbi:MAG: TIGR02594 family protein [Vitreoscilla sp.]